MSYFQEHSLLSSSMWEGGPTPGGFYPMQHQPQSAQSFVGGPVSAPEEPRQHTSRPIVTGTSVLAVKFEGGVAIAADTLGSYGSLARFRQLSRLVKVGESTIVGGSGDVADFHKIRDFLNTYEIENVEADDDHQITPKAVHAYLTRILYHRRSKQDPLWNTVVVAGLDSKKQPYLGVCDKLGVAFEETAIATGYGAHIALPLMRTAVEGETPLDQDAAVALLRDCLRVLWYRDARSLNRYEIATVTADGATILPPESAESDWSIASMVRGYD